MKACFPFALTAVSLRGCGQDSVSGKQDFVMTSETGRGDAFSSHDEKSPLGENALHLFFLLDQACPDWEPHQSDAVKRVA